LLLLGPSSGSSSSLLLLASAQKQSEGKETTEAHIQNFQMLDFDVHRKRA
jgi:hypothetical protein